MRWHWQREPLLVRSAFPGFADPLSPRDVLRLACSPDAAARLVRHARGAWSVEHGPFQPRRFSRLPARDWTVLVQDTNHFSQRAGDLLARFDFIAHARVDDVMVSYAVPGGGVGPHVDSYDVFLLQGRGRRRWRISRQKDLAFVPGLPLKILARFRAEQEWVLEAGDMLYLPPGVAHEGVAETECLTWSIGFRAPTDRELVAGFLDFLHEKLEPRGQYGDAGTRARDDPARSRPRSTAHVGRVLRGHPLERNGRARVRRPVPLGAQGAGAFRALRGARFRARASSSARRAAAWSLDPRSRLLFSGTMLFLNGERVRAAPAAARGSCARLADARAPRRADRGAARRSGTRCTRGTLTASSRATGRRE